MASDSRQTDKPSYRRGLVLGLTLAEAMLLLIFVLLLTFEIARELRERQRQEQVALLQKEVEEARKRREQYNACIQRFGNSGKADVNEVFTQLTLCERNKEVAERFAREQKEKADAWNVLVMRILREEASTAEVKQKQEEILQRFEYLEGVVSKQGRVLKPHEALERCTDELATVKAQGMMCEAAGRGWIPPCWVTTERGRPRGVSIFDVAVTDTGMLIRDRPEPTHMGTRKADLPISEIPYDKVLDEKAFNLATSELDAHGRAAQCRHMVRLFDCTSAGSKAAHIANRKIVEGPFFIENMASASFACPAGQS